MAKTCVPIGVPAFRAISDGAEYSMTGEISAEQVQRGEIITLVSRSGERMDCEVIEDPTALDPEWSTFKVKRYKENRQ